jgi:hypothetical protein
MIKIGYRRCEYDYCVYVRSLDDDSFIFVTFFFLTCPRKDKGRGDSNL